MGKRNSKKARDERKNQTSSGRKREDQYGDIRPEHDMWGKIPKRLHSHYLLVLPQAHSEPEHTEPLKPETEAISSVPEHEAPAAATTSPEPVEALPLQEWTKADLLRHKLKRSV